MLVIENYIPFLPIDQFPYDVVFYYGEDIAIALLAASIYAFLKIN